jgi:hypothetical protein
MVQRRGYSVVDDVSDIVDMFSAKNLDDKLITIYFIETCKVNINIITKIISTSPSKDVIIIYKKSLTTDAKHAVTVNNIYNFEIFSFDEMAFDLLEICQPHKLYTGPVLKECNKFPKILSSDIVCRYYNFQPGSIIVISENGNMTLRKCI